MTWRRHLRTVRATLGLWVLAIVTLATRARTWLAQHRGGGARIPDGVHMLVGLEPDDVAEGATSDAVIDLTDHDHVAAGPARR